MVAPQPYTADDFPRDPLLVFYETTRACNLLCSHCRATAQRKRHPDELTTEQAKALTDDLLRFDRPPLIVFTGGDPMKRPDVFELVDYCVGKGLMVAMTPSATPLVTHDALQRLKDAGLHRLAVSLDGPDADTHDRFRGVPGSFKRTMEILLDAKAMGLPVQVNTTIAKHNVDQLEAMAEAIREMGIVLWSVFFLIPTGRATLDQRIDGVKMEEVFARLFALTRKMPFAIKTTEAPHYRRFLQQVAASMPAASPVPPGRPTMPVVGTNDGRGVMFVSHIGEIFPSGFLPVECGRFPRDSVVDVYRNSPLMVSLRDSSQLRGKCGFCDWRDLCGGSRARAFGVSGDPLAAEPDCVYVPPKYLESLMT